MDDLLTQRCFILTSKLQRIVFLETVESSPYCFQEIIGQKDAQLQFDGKAERGKDS